MIKLDYAFMIPPTEFTGYIDRETREQIWGGTKRKLVLFRVFQHSKNRQFDSFAFYTI